MKILKLILLGTLSLTMLNCGSAEKEELTKTEVKKRKVDGDTTDYCEQFGWYDDGVCDSFCKKPDPECSVNCLAAPVCEQGYIEVEACEETSSRPNGGAEADPIGAPQFTDCFDVTICGTTIHCKADTISCLAIALECPQGSTLVDGCPPDGDCTIIDDGCTQITCLQGSVACGGDALNVPCNGDEFCKYEETCGADGLLGTCEIKPDACPENYAPVCGCDGRTYGNECSANSSGTSVVSIGECPTVCAADTDCLDGQTCVNGTCQTETACGGFVGDTCGADEFCDYQLEDICGRADATGICQIKPDACALGIVAPVCGCDGQDYLTECDANVVGVSVLSEGECPVVCASDNDCGETESCVNGVCEEAQVICGGNAPNPVRCAADEFCLIAPADMCGIADAPGVCTTQPMNCAAVFDPVCGCDNVTYGNECTAWANGASVAANGACKPN